VENKTKTRSIDRALDIIETFTFRDPELTLVEISKRTGLALATVHRAIQTLLARGYIEQNPISGKYRLGMEFVRVGGVVIQRLDLVKIATPFLRDLSRKTEQHVNLSIYDRGEALCLVNVESFHSFRQGIQVGQRLPIYAGALSKVILAHLPAEKIEGIITDNLVSYTPQTIAQKEALLDELAAIKRQGYAESRGELALGAAALAAPMRNYENKVVAGISVSGPEHFYTGKNVGYFIGELLYTAADISHELGYSDALLKGH